MTAWQDPPLTRREARERRAQESQARSQDRPNRGQDTARRSRRAGTVEAVPAGRVPVQPVPDAPDDSEPVEDAIRPHLGEDGGDPVTAPVVRPAESPQRDAGDHPPSAPGQTLTRRQLRAMREAEEAKRAAALHTDAVPVTPAPQAVRSAPPAEPTAEPAEKRQRPFDAVIGRDSVSSGTTTTANALILPSVPTIPDATGPLTRTGEVLVTGSIDLPRSLGSTGRHPTAFDSPAADHLYDEPEVDTATAAPVSASRAVSTNVSSQESITPRKGRGAAVPVILAIAAAALAVGVIGLFIAGYVLGLF